VAVVLGCRQLGFWLAIKWVTTRNRRPRTCERQSAGPLIFLEMNTSNGKKMISMGSIAWAASVALLLFCQGVGATVVMSSARTQFGSNNGRLDISASLASTASPEISKIRGGSAIGRHNAGPWGNFMRTIKEARRHLVAAGVARCVSITAMYPVDTIKVRTT
jgi:hypothetical protein